MSRREQAAPRGREPACLLCRRSEADSDICGEKLFIHGFCAHENCLFFASNFPNRPVHRGGLWCLHSWEIRAVVSQAAEQSCCICGQSGATISCWDGTAGRAGTPCTCPMPGQRELISFPFPIRTP
ncbi:G2/M phase-specific E3 ubiquitin-protein ligase-like [Manacus candei]|uniref:G2/M phase-specific E3 ubiquitin-protein ligase-like n=1 Tax=Manacus candei TaxID=415023 RepID=UPI002225EEA8|nr:G2/M phase-specific E3 ubiquitin-protein ligase-like [Manacus candei]